jgi:bacteriochlorophyllide a dehydrogenase
MELDTALHPHTAKHRTDDRAQMPALRAHGVVFSGKCRADLTSLKLKAPADGDVIVDVAWSGISTGTERMLWSGEMPPFPGMGYPLVPGYESVGRIIHAPGQPEMEGRMAFIPGASCYEDASGLFGASASRLVVPAARITLLGEDADPQHTLLALAATAHHAIVRGKAPDLVIGNGVLGRLVARITDAITGQVPTIWETNPVRRTGSAAIDPSSDTRFDYGAPCDVSGSIAAIDQAITHCARGAEITLAGFYKERPSFAFPPAFMKEISLHVAAEWRPEDLNAVLAMVRDGVLSLDGLITHTTAPDDISGAYETAFDDSSCLKMIIDWELQP